MRSEVVVSPTPPGAGRFRDFVWPEPGNLDGNPTALVGNRLGTELVGTAPIAVTTGFTGGTTTGVATIAGIDCAAVNSTGAGAGFGYRFDVMMVTHIKTSLNTLPFQVDDEQCFRVFCNMAGQGVPVAGTDYGWYMTTPNTNGRILGDAAIGFGFNIVDGNVVNFLARGPLGLITQPLTSAPFNTFAFHSYEMRITSATAIADASLAILIDNVPVVMPVNLSTWGGVTALPPSQVLGGRVGFRPGIYNTSGVTQALYVQKLRYVSAPTIQATF